MKKHLGTIDSIGQGHNPGYTRIWRNIYFKLKETLEVITPTSLFTDEETEKQEG